MTDPCMVYMLTLGVNVSICTIHGSYGIFRILFAILSTTCSWNEFMTELSFVNMCQVALPYALCIAVHSLCSLQEYYAVAEGFQSVRTHWRWWSAQTRGSLFSAHRSGEDNGGTLITPSIPFIGPRNWCLLSKVICSFLTVQIRICRVYLWWGPLHWGLIVFSSNIFRYLASNPWMACSAPAHTACGCWIQGLIHVDSLILVLHWQILTALSIGSHDQLRSFFLYRDFWF